MYSQETNDVLAGLPQAEPSAHQDLARLAPRLQSVRDRLAHLQATRARLEDEMNLVTNDLGATEAELLPLERVDAELQMHISQAQG